MSRWALIAVASWALSAWAVVPTAGAMPAYTPLAINNGPGDSFDPHVSGDLVAYTHDATIHYYRFSTGLDTEIPLGASYQDLLSDTDGNLIVFSRVLIDRTAVFVFDTTTATATEIDAAAGTSRFSAVIGGGTLAYIDSNLGAGGELVIHDMASNTSQRITNDSAFDVSPSVSPDGSVVVWQHCLTSYTLCDIWEAQKVGSSWAVSITNADPSNEELPDTNGSLIVYDSDRPSGAGDIFYKAVTGGAETELELAGIQINPNMSGKFVAFESRNGGPGDIYLYDVSANAVYQVTNTALTNEELDDMTVLADGSVRLVWDNDEAGGSARHVYSATFSLGGAGGGMGGGGGSGGGGGDDDCDDDDGDGDGSGWHHDGHGHWHHDHGHHNGWGHGHGHHCHDGGDHGHGDGDGSGGWHHHGESLSSDSTRNGAVGCNGFGGTPWMALAALALLWLTRRPQPAPARAKKR